MEGLGAAASVVGLASIALQLVGTIRDINSFLNSFSKAPEEIQRLADNLGLLSGVLQDVRNFAEMQLRQENIPLLSSTIFIALKACEKDLIPLKAMMRKAQAGYGSSQKTKRKWDFIECCEQERGY